MGCGLSEAHIASTMGVSRKCVKTWVDRHASEGVAGLAEQHVVAVAAPVAVPNIRPAPPGAVT